MGSCCCCCCGEGADEPPGGEGQPSYTPLAQTPAPHIVVCTDTAEDVLHLLRKAASQVQDSEGGDGALPHTALGFLTAAQVLAAALRTPSSAPAVLSAAAGALTPPELLEAWSTLAAATLSTALPHLPAPTISPPRLAVLATAASAPGTGIPDRIHLAAPVLRAVQAAVGPLDAAVLVHEAWSAALPPTALRPAIEAARAVLEIARPYPCADTFHDACRACAPLSLHIALGGAGGGGPPCLALAPDALATRRAALAGAARKMPT